MGGRRRRGGACGSACAGPPVRHPPLGNTHVRRRGHLPLCTPPSNAIVPQFSLGFVFLSLSVTLSHSLLFVFFSAAVVFACLYSVRSGHQLHIILLPIIIPLRQNDIRIPLRMYIKVMSDYTTEHCGPYKVYRRWYRKEKNNPFR